MCLVTSLVMEIVNSQQQFSPLHLWESWERIYSHERAIHFSHSAEILQMTMSSDNTGWIWSIVVVKGVSTVHSLTMSFLLTWFHICILIWVKLVFLFILKFFYSKNYFYCLCNTSFLTSPNLFLKGSIFLLYFFLIFLLLCTDQSEKWNFRKRWTHCSSILKQHSVNRITLISIYIQLLPFSYTVSIEELCCIKTMEISMFTDHVFSKINLNIWTESILQF